MTHIAWYKSYSRFNRLLLFFSVDDRGVIELGKSRTTELDKGEVRQEMLLRLKVILSPVEGNAGRGVGKV